MEENYTGWKKWELTTDEWNDFYNTRQVPFEMLENEYLILCPEGEHPLYYCYEHGEFRQFHGGSIKTYKEKNEEELRTTDDAAGGKKKKKTTRHKNVEQTVIYPRNDEQACAFDLIKDESKTIKLLLGVWGSGKDYIMANAAIEALNLGKYEQIVWIRNNVRVRDTPDLGAVPGGVEDKLIGYVGPFIDVVGEAKVRTLLAKDALKIEPLQSLRGRNFANSIIICSEAENLSYDHLKLIVARVAEGSSLWLNGDVRQRDMASFEKSQGIEKFIKCLAGEELFGYVYLPTTERSATARLADKLDAFAGNY